MTDTLISIISIFMGIIGAQGLGNLKKKHSMGLIGNTIAGIFGSIFFIKTLGRLGFDPMSVMATGKMNTTLFTLNMIISLLGGAIALVVIKLISTKLNA